MLCLDRLLTDHQLDAILSKKERVQGGSNAGILYEMQKEGRDQESKGYHNEKQTSCDSRCMPEVRD
jgi:hypothetical protein